MKLSHLFLFCFASATAAELTWQSIYVWILEHNPRLNRALAKYHWRGKTINCPAPPIVANLPLHKNFIGFDGEEPRKGYPYTWFPEHDPEEDPDCLLFYGDMNLVEFYNTQLPLGDYPTPDLGRGEVFHNDGIERNPAEGRRHP